MSRSPETPPKIVQIYVKGALNIEAVKSATADEQNLNRWPAYDTKKRG